MSKKLQAAATIAVVALLVFSVVVAIDPYLPGAAPTEAQVLAYNGPPVTIAGADPRCAQRYDDGIVVDGASLTKPRPRHVPGSSDTVIDDGSRECVPFWCRGPVRRLVSAPFRWLRNRRCR